MRGPSVCDTWLLSAASTGHSGRPLQRNQPHTRHAQSCKDPITPAASTSTILSSQTMEDAPSIHCSWCTSTPPSLATNSPASSYSQCRWTWWSLFPPITHQPAQQRPASHVICPVARLSVTLLGTWPTFFFLSCPLCTYMIT